MCRLRWQVFLIFAFLILNTSVHSVYSDELTENLFIKPLPSGHVYTQFRFVVRKDLNDHYEDSFNHFHLFPRSLGEIISQHHVQEMHFSLTQGLWRYEKWGYPMRGAPPGAELWTLFKGNASEINSNWKRLTHVLSGQFCASLNFIDDSNTAIPKLSFRPQGALPVGQTYNSSFVRFSSLPHEIVCTENLTPFQKLLPCGAKAGLSTLMNALNVFKAHYVSIAVDVQNICKAGCSKSAVELIQSVSIVFDPPVQQAKQQDWSFVKLFGSSLSSTCPVAAESEVFVDISSNKSGIPFALNKPFEMILEDVSSMNGNKDIKQFAVFDLKEMLESARQVNIGATYKSSHIYGIIPPPVLHADRKISGYGQERGGIHCTFFNNHPKEPLKILYFDMIPWYLRLYSHTLSIKNGANIITPDYFYYEPAKDRRRPHHLELAFVLPANSRTELSIEFDLAFLKWTEYPPDANHGFYAGSAVVSAMLDATQNCSAFPGDFRKDTGTLLRIYTQILLVSLPTPDFSMPYNVICLTCTVVALAFGPLHNLTTKNLQPLEENRDSFLTRIKKKTKNWWKLVAAAGSAPDGDGPEESKKTQ